MRRSVPFDFHSASFKQSFLAQYMLPLGEWLLGSDDDFLLAQNTGSPWEASLTANYLIRAFEIATEHQPEWAEQHGERIGAKIAALVPWLLDQAEWSSHRWPDQTESAELACWDHVTWDTGTVLRTLLLIRQKHPHLIRTEDAARIDMTIRAAVHWQVVTFHQWGQTGKYAFGSADIATVALSLLAAAESGLAEKGFVSLGKGPSVDLRETLDEIVEHLLFAANDPTLPLGFSAFSDVCTKCWWDDYFTSSEVVEALGEYIRFSEGDGAKSYKKDLSPGKEMIKDKETKRREDLVCEARNKIVACLHFFGLSQAPSGMWGSHADTLKALKSYVSGSFYVSTEKSSVGFTPEVHIAFKALRWICDEKQFFRSNSFQHTLFLSTFCSQTFMAIFDHWKPAEKATSELFDDVIWSSPVRSDEERGEKAKLQIAHDQLRRDHELQKLEADGLGEKINSLVNANRRLMASWFVGFLALIALANLEILDIRIENRQDVAGLISVLGVSGALLAAIMFAISAVSRNRN